MWGGRIQKRKGSYIWPRDFVPVLKQLLVPVGVLISRLCNQRNLFSPSLLKAQQRQNHPSHPSPKHSDHLSPVSSLLLYRIFDSDLGLNPQVDRSVIHTQDTGQTYRWAQFITSSLLLTVTSKGPASSVSVFKTSGHNREFFNLPHKHLQSTERD